MNLSNGDSMEAYLCNKYIYYTRVQNFFLLIRSLFLTGFMSTWDMQSPFFTLPSPRLLCYFSFYMAFMKSSISLWWRRAQGHCTCNGIFLYWSGNFILFCSLRLIPITNGHPVGTTFLIQCHTQKSSGLGKIYSTCTNILGYCGK